MNASPYMKLNEEIKQATRLAEIYRNSECWEDYMEQVIAEGLDEDLAGEVWEELNWKFSH